MTGTTPDGAGPGPESVGRSPAGPRRSGRAAPLACIIGGLALVAIATAFMLRRVEPFATAYYIFAWYGTLLALDGAVALVGGVRASALAVDAGAAGAGGGRFLLLSGPRFALSLLAWSAVAWLFFELLNFRLTNWYYVFLPPDPVLRWPSILLSFATVLPAIMLAEAVLAGVGVAQRARSPRLRLTPPRLRGLRIAGLVMLALPMLWPRYFYPLVWGGVVLLIEPSTYARNHRRSLLGDLERGEPGRILRLLIGGAAIGLVWELFNIRARGKWIYTVPGFEELKLFEMPVLGFLGFPPFALECFVIWQALVLGGVAVPRRRRGAEGNAAAALAAARRTRLGAALAAAAFSIAVLAGMEQRTITSYVPRLTDLPEVPAEPLARAGYDAFSLAAAPPERIAGIGGIGPERAQRAVDMARLATLRGIGAENARDLMRVGVQSVEELARRDPESLAAELMRLRGGGVVAARVRVWVRAAREAVGPARRATRRS